jgi:hypothetical protein
LIHEEIKGRWNSGIGYYQSVQILLSFHLLSKIMKIKIHKSIILPVVLCGCETWSVTLRKEHKNGRRLYRVLVGKPEGKKEITRKT